MTDLAERRGLKTDVYQPAEDSALLADAATERVAAGDLVLEVGVGSGWVAAHVAEAVGARVVGSDLNPHACRRTRERGVPAVRATLVEAFADATFDAVLFNPPYLPTDPDDEWDDWMERALSGGATGRAVVDPFLDTVGRVLRPDGFVLLLVSSLTGVEETEARAEANGFAVTAVAERSFPYETLSVLRLVRR